MARRDWGKLKNFKVGILMLYRSILIFKTGAVMQAAELCSDFSKIFFMHLIYNGWSIDAPTTIYLEYTTLFTMIQSIKHMIMRSTPASFFLPVMQLINIHTIHNYIARFKKHHSIFIWRFGTLGALAPGAF